MAWMRAATDMTAKEARAPVQKVLRSVSKRTSKVRVRELYPITPVPNSVDSCVYVGSKRGEIILPPEKVNWRTKEEMTVSLFVWLKKF